MTGLLARRPGRRDGAVRRRAALRRACSPSSAPTWSRSSHRGGDAYRYVMPVAPGIGRFFVPLNRGKRSVVLDLKTDRRPGSRCALLAATADVVLHNFPPTRAERVRPRVGRAARGACRGLVARRRHVVRGGRAAGGRTGLRPRRAGALGSAHRPCIAGRHRAGARRRDSDGRPHGRSPALDRACSRRCVPRAGDRDRRAGRGVAARGRAGGAGSGSRLARGRGRRAAGAPRRARDLGRTCRRDPDSGSTPTRTTAVTRRPTASSRSRA